MDETTPQTPTQEERYPLLFLLLEDGQKSNKKGKGLFFERGRSQGIISGTSNILTQWPGYLSSCGLTMIILILAILFLFLMILACSIHPTEHPLRPRCFKRSFDGKSRVGLYLVHNDETWDSNQLTVLEEILAKYNQCDSELISIREETKNDKPVKRRPKRFAKERMKMNINVGGAMMRGRHIVSLIATNSSSIHPFYVTTENPDKNGLEKIVKRFPKLKLTNTTKREFFEHTPLYDSYKNLNKNLINFAARVLRLWENGGISFALPEIEDSKLSKIYKYDVVGANSSKNASNSNRQTIESMVDLGYVSFRSLPEGLVTVDEEGIHMETKTTCHAFFGEALNQLKKAKRNGTVDAVIKGTLETFCVKGAVDSDYCNSVKSRG